MYVLNLVIFMELLDILKNMPAQKLNFYGSIKSLCFEAHSGMRIVWLCTRHAKSLSATYE